MHIVCKGILNIQILMGRYKFARWYLMIVTQCLAIRLRIIKQIPNLEKYHNLPGAEPFFRNIIGATLLKRFPMLSLPISIQLEY